MSLKNVRPCKPEILFEPEDRHRFIPKALRFVAVDREAIIALVALAEEQNQLAEIRHGAFEWLRSRFSSRPPLGVIVRRLQAGCKDVARFAGVFERLAVDGRNGTDFMQHTGASHFGQSVIGDDPMVVKVFGQREIEVFDFVFLPSHDFDEATASVLVERFFRHQARRARREVRRGAVQRFEALREIRGALSVRRDRHYQY